MPARSLAVLMILAAELPVGRAQTALPGTKPFTFEGDLALGMVDAIRTFLERETAAAADRRAALPVPMWRSTVRNFAV